MSLKPQGLCGALSIARTSVPSSSSAAGRTWTCVCSKDVTSPIVRMRCASCVAGGSNCKVTYRLLSATGLKGLRGRISVRGGNDVSRR